MEKRTILNMGTFIFKCWIKSALYLAFPTVIDAVADP